MTTVSTGYKLLSYQAPAGPRAGVKIGDSVFDAELLSGRAQFATVIGALNGWEIASQIFAQAAKHPPAEIGLPFASVELLAPVLYPGEIFAAGANYQDHIAEMRNTEFPAENAKIHGGRPWHFSKSSRGAVIGHGSIRPLPPYSKKVDWEIELAVVIGRAASRIPAGSALDYVAGYTIANDLSARDFVARDSVEAGSPFRFDWISHKGFDGACPLGPWITPAGEIPDPQVLGLKLWIDDELTQNSNTRHMIFSVAEQIEELSARVTLNPGDVILTGTPSGVGMQRNVFLKSGQRLRLWIEKIGELHHGFS
jgi:2-keto-4-pentenoate hydratase/2-oxohepta-3-ene-1,7-dioic acid hydratase in catechol pathway